MKKNYPKCDCEYEEVTEGGMTIFKNKNGLRISYCPTCGMPLCFADNMWFQNDHKDNQPAKMREGMGV